MRSLLLIAPIALSLVPSLAFAQDAETRARQLFELGVSAMDSGNPATAEPYFQQSFQLSPRASTACNLATAQEQLGRPCEARGWYFQCSNLDTTGAFRDRANGRASALAGQCAAVDPFVRTPTNSLPSAPTSTSGGVQIVEQGMQTVRPPPPRVDHTMLGFGIAGLVLAGGALAGALVSVEAAHGEANAITQDGGILVEGTPDADRYDRATTYGNLGLGLYAAAGVLGGLGAVLVILDLAQPGVFGGTAANEGVRLRLGAAGGELAFSF